MRSRFLLGVIASLIAGTAYWWFAKQSPSHHSASRDASQNDGQPSAARPELDEAATGSTPANVTGSGSANVTPNTSAAPATRGTASTPSTGASTPSGTSPATASAPVANSINALTPAAPKAPAAPAPAAPIVTADACTTQVFTHQEAEGHEDGEACLYHKNLINLTGFAESGVEINSKSICVRANNKPVKFKYLANKKGPQIMLGAVAGPTTKISVTFCTGKMTCASDCTIPKDDFMEAIGAAETDEDLFTDRGSKVGWKKGKNPQKEEEAVQRELAELKKTVKDELRKGSLFEGWDMGSTTPAVCGRSRAQK